MRPARAGYLLACALLGSSLLGTAQAADLCSGFLGQVVAPQTFEQAASELGFPARPVAVDVLGDPAPGSAPGVLAMRRVIRTTVGTPEWFEYDADRQALRIRPHVFSWREMDYWHAFRSIRPRPVISVSTSNIAVVLSMSDIEVALSEETVSDGQTLSVMRLLRTTQAIFERQAWGMETLFSRGEAEPYVGEIPLSRDRAEILRPQLGAALVVQPRAPYVVAGRHLAQEPSEAGPTRVIENFQVMTADIQCGLVLDPDNKVLASVPTR